MSRRERDPERERRERDGFAVLLHVWTLASDGIPAVARASIARALALGADEAATLLDALIHHAFLVPVGGGMRVALSDLGDSYLVSGAGRRRSVRFTALPG